MVEVAAEPERTARTSASASRPRRHAIVLCCAESVRALVDEIGHSLAGLGFATEVVCGKEARAILLGRDRDITRPTVYVVCVQGSLKEQVLEPLRQALVAHGGPNQHLFAAVLDVTLPLAMVGQVRGFCEALDRLPAGAARGSGRERRAWREHHGGSPIERSAKPPRRATERVPTLLRPPKATIAVPTVLRPPAIERPEPEPAHGPSTVEPPRLAALLEPAPRRGRSMAIAAFAVAAATVGWLALPASDARSGAGTPTTAPTASIASASSAADDDDDAPITATPAATSAATRPAAARSPADDTDEGLLAALASHRIRRGPNLWVSRPQGDTTTWSIARERCAEFEVDGVGGWRLPFRRELQMLRVAGLVDDGAWWSRTLVEDDKDAAYVLDAGKGELVVWLRAEPNAGTLCVRPRAGD